MELSVGTLIIQLIIDESNEYQIMDIRNDPLIPILKIKECYTYSELLDR